MQRMRHASFHGAQGRVQRLAQHLAAENPAGAEVAALAPEKVLFKLLQLELIDEILQAVRAHRVGSRVHAVKRTASPPENAVR